MIKTSFYDTKGGHMSKKKKDKTIQRPKQRQYKRVETYICEECEYQCAEYLKFKRTVKPGRVYKGILCKKNIGGEP